MEGVRWKVIERREKERGERERERECKRNVVDVFFILSCC